MPLTEIISLLLDNIDYLSRVAFDEDNTNPIFKKLILLS